MPAPVRSRLARPGRTLLLALGCLLCPQGLAGPADEVLFVSPAGRDTWSGRLPAPNRDLSDGPFATLARARDAIRSLKADSSGLRRFTVQLRGGAYYFDAPVVFGPEDSGSEGAPITYAAFPGEVPELIGGRRLSGFRPGPAGGPVAVELPRADSGLRKFRSLFVDGRREVRARFPNQDPLDPIRKGFLYAEPGPGIPTLGVAVGRIHNPGDWLDYRIVVPKTGAFTLWMHYGADNAPYGMTSMDGRTSVLVDGKGQVSLGDLRNTGAWSPARWARAATLRLSAGEHILRWQNQQGGGLVFDAMLLCDEPAWQPLGTRPAAPEAAQLVGVAAKDFIRSHGRQITVSGSGGGPRDAIWCAPGTVREAWLAAPEAEVHIFQSGECRAFSEILSILEYDPKERRLQLGGPEARASLNPGDRYFVENVREELDAPGEWFADFTAGSLLYLPRPGFSSASEVIAPMVTRILQVEGSRAIHAPVKHLRFAGLTFRNTDWDLGGGSEGYGVGGDGAILLRDAEACTVERCRFLNLGAYAVSLVRGRGNTVRECEVAHAGGGGVLLQESAGNLVTENHVHHIGEAYHHVGGVVLAGAASSDNTVSHNTIHDSSRYGISLKEPGRKNAIEFNRIRNTNLETSDSGGIEVTQHDRAFRSGSSIRYNLVADTIGYSDSFGVPIYMSWGIYLDSFASGYTVEGNLVCRTWNGGFMLQGGRENRVVNNIFVDGQTSQGTIANFEGQSSGLQLTRNILAFSRPEATVFETGDLGPEVIHIDQNLYGPPGGLLPRFGAGGALSLADWRKRGRDLASLAGDPRFRKATADDFALLPDSPAFRLGFKALPLDRMGARPKACMCEVRPAAGTFWPSQRRGGAAPGSVRAEKDSRK